MTDYELQRAYNILEKNQMFHRLGLGKLRELVGTKPVAVVHEESDPLYEPGEDTEQGVVDRVYMQYCTMITCVQYAKSIFPILISCIMQGPELIKFAIYQNIQSIKASGGTS